ncbi:hypothetical protein CDD83_1555 [Cordyceps sp. RAO-2017]|nr:hypothetical protein CDD83_1555 [Cordyceps sp. RAO-2017]
MARSGWAASPTPLADSSSAGVDQTEAQEPSSVYKLVMTPVNFISFLVSLALVDLCYTQTRQHRHAERPSRLPCWLRTLLFRPQPYRAFGRRERGTGPAGHGEWHYHSNQEKLMEMEAADALNLRGAVLVLLALALAGATGLAYYGLSSLCRHFQP